MRTIRLYLQRKVLPPTRVKGSATRYQRRRLLWLLAIKRLLAAERLKLSEVRARLSSLAEAELEALATEEVAPGILAQALGLQGRDSGAQAGTAQAGSASV